MFLVEAFIPITSIVCLIRDVIKLNILLFLAQYVTWVNNKNEIRNVCNTKWNSMLLF